MVKPMLFGKQLEIKVDAIAILDADISVDPENFKFFEVLAKLILIS